MQSGERVSIRGHVGGQVSRAAQSVTIDGEVGGSVLGVGTETLAITSPRIAGNLYGGRRHDRREPTWQRSNRTPSSPAEHVQLAGAVGRDVFTGGRSVEVSGSIGGHLTAYAERIALRAPAHIAGNVNANVSRADRLDASGAVIDGELKTEIMEPHKEESEYRTGDFYLFQLLRFAAALLTGCDRARAGARVCDASTSIARAMRCSRAG